MTLKPLGIDKVTFGNSQGNNSLVYSLFIAKAFISSLGAIHNIGIFWQLPTPDEIYNLKIAGPESFAINKIASAKRIAM